MLGFTLHDTDGPKAAAFEPTALVIAGWAGRGQAAVDHHIKELAAIGVPRPSTVPIFYRVAAATLTYPKSRWSHIHPSVTHHVSLLSFVANQVDRSGATNSGARQKFS
jgi:hypothetical protein